MNAGHNPWMEALDRIQPAIDLEAELGRELTDDEFTDALVRADAVKRSKEKYAAFCDEVQAGHLENAYELGLVDRLTGKLKRERLDDAVLKLVKPIPADDNAEWESPVVEWILRDARKNAEAAAGFEAPKRKYKNLREALAAPREKTKYLVDGLLIAGENLLLTAEYKAGKTTFVGWLVYCLITGAPFLGHDVGAVNGNVTIWDTELPVDYALDQLELLGLPEELQERVIHEPLKGYRIPITTNVGKKWAVEKLKADNTEIWAIDTYGAMFDGDENSSSDVRDWLHAVDEIKRLAGVKTVVLVTHTGKTDKTTARGSSYLGGWSGANWSIAFVKDDPSIRAFSVGVGRGVQGADMFYSWTPEDGLQVADAPMTEKGKTRSDFQSRIVEFVTLNPRSSIQTVRKGCGATEGQRNTVSDILHKLVKDGSMTMEQLGQAKLFSVVPLVPMTGL